MAGRGAQPKPEGYATLKAMGVRTVINLRTRHGEREAVEAAADVVSLVSGTMTLAKASLPDHMDESVSEGPRDFDVNERSPESTAGGVPRSVMSGRSIRPFPS